MNNTPKASQYCYFRISNICVCLQQALKILFPVTHTLAKYLSLISCQGGFRDNWNTCFLKLKVEAEISTISTLPRKNPSNFAMSLFFEKPYLFQFLAEGFHSIIIIRGRNQVKECLVFPQWIEDLCKCVGNVFTSAGHSGFEQIPDINNPLKING